MKPEWIEYTGSDEQLNEINSAENYITRLNKNKRTEYLICQPHQYAKEIKQWAETGQPVYWRSKTVGNTGECYENFPPFAHPDIFEYRFTPFEES